MSRITPYVLFRGTVATVVMLLVTGVIVLMLPLFVVSFMLFCALCALYFKSFDAYLERIKEVVSDLFSDIKTGLRTYLRVFKRSV